MLKKSTFAVGLIQLFLIDAFVGSTAISLQSMSIKHASSVVLKEDGKAAGKGEINAAFSALDNICDFVLPMAWVRVSLWFYERAAHARSDPLTLLGMSIPPLSSGTLTHALWHWCLYARKTKNVVCRWAVPPQRNAHAGGAHGSRGRGRVDALCG